MADPLLAVAGQEVDDRDFNHRIATRLLAAGFNRTPYLPSTYDWQHSLSISNSHASIGALAAVLVVGIVVLLAGAMWLVSRVRRFSGAEGEAS